MLKAACGKRYFGQNGSFVVNRPILGSNCEVDYTKGVPVDDEADLDRVVDGNSQAAERCLIGRGLFKLWWKIHHLHYHHTSYLSFFLHEQNFWRIKFTPKKRVNYGKIHSKLPFFVLLREPREYPCKFFLAGVNFYRFNAKIGNLLCNLS